MYHLLHYCILQETRHRNILGQVGLNTIKRRLKGDIGHRKIFTPIRKQRRMDHRFVFKMAIAGGFTEIFQTRFFLSIYSLDPRSGSLTCCGEQQQHAQHNHDIVAHYRYVALAVFPFSASE